MVVGSTSKVDVVVETVVDDVVVPLYSQSYQCAVPLGKVPFQ